MTSAITVQTNFRGRDDSQTINSTTFTYNLNTNWSQAVDTNFRIRIEAEEQNSRNAAIGALEYNRNSAGWVAVSSVSSIVKYSLTSQFANLDATTNIIAGSTKTFVAGDGVETTVTTTNINNTHTEYEYSLQIVAADVANNDTIQVRMSGLNTYTNTPTITVIKALAIDGICDIVAFPNQSFNSTLIIPSAVNAQANVSQGFSPNLSIDSILNFGSYNLLNLLSFANVLSEIGIDGKNTNEMNVLLGLISNVGLIQNNYLSLIPSNYINSNTVFALQNLLNLDPNNVVNSNLSTLLSTYLTLSSDATRILLGELNISLLNNLLLNSNNVIKSIFETSLYGILNENSTNLIQSLLVSESEIILSLMAKDTINANLNTILSSYLTLITEIQSTHYGEINIVSLNNFLLNSNNIIKSIFEILLHEELDQNSINLIQSLLISESETMLSLVSKNIVNAIFENQLLNLIDGTSILLILSNIDFVTALNTYFRSGDFEPALITASLESLLNMQQSFSSLNEILGESSLINSLGIIVNAINNIKAFSSMLNSIEVILDSKKEIYATDSIQSFLLNDINGKNIEISHINLSGNLYNVSNALINILSNIEISNEEDLQLNSKLIIGATQLLYGLGIIEPIGRSGIFQTVPTPDQRTYAIIENKNTLIIIDKEGRIFSIPIQNRKLFFPKE